MTRFAHVAAGDHWRHDERSGATMARGLNDSGSTTTDGTVVWTDRGPVLHDVCDPSNFINATFDLNNLRVNCVFPTVNRDPTSGAYLTLTGAPGQSSLADNNGFGLFYDSGTFWDNPPLWSPGIIGVGVGLDFGSGADQLIVPHFPPGYQKLVIDAVVASGFSADASAAIGGVYNGVSHGSCSVVISSQHWGYAIGSVELRARLMPTVQTGPASTGGPLPGVIPMGWFPLPQGIRDYTSPLGPRL